jgi:hypothetical protein
VLGVATSYPVEKLSDANWVTPTLKRSDLHRAMPNLKFGP